MLLLAPCMLFCLFSVAAVDDKALIDIVRVGHRHAVESIRTIRAEFSVTTMDGDRKGERWETRYLEDDLGRQRYSERRILPLPAPDDFTSPREAVTECVNLRAERRQLVQWHQADGTVKFDGAISGWEPSHGMSELWLHALVVYSQRPYRRVSEVLDGKLGRFTISRSPVDPQLVNVFFKTDAGTSYTFTISLKHNCLAQRIEEMNPPQLGTYRVITEVLEFMEIDRGVFFPKTVRKSVEETKGGETGYLQILMTDVAINEALPEDTFQLEFPKGCSLINELEGTVEVVGVTGPREFAPSQFMDPVPTDGTISGRTLFLVINAIALLVLLWIRIGRAQRGS